MIRRYEFTEGSSKKFWEIELEDEAFTARWGRIGTEGQEKEQSFDSAADARRAADKLIAEKEKKGYVLVGAGKEGAAKPVAKRARNPELEKLVAENPDDKANFLVYADWLQQQGDPLGEVISLACNGKEAEAKKKINANKELFFGEIGGDPVLQNLEYHHGVLSSVRLTDIEGETQPMINVLEQLLKLPIARFLRTLSVGLPQDLDGDSIDYTFDGIFSAIGKTGPHLALATLDGTEWGDGMDQASWARVGDVRPLWRGAPRLKVLRLNGSRGSEGSPQLKLGTIEAPELETLTIESSGLDGSAVKDIGASHLPKLSHLELWLGEEDHGRSATVKSLAAIFEGKSLPALSYLGLKNANDTDELIAPLAAAKILKRLDTVDLSMGTMSSAGAQILIEHHRAFAHLESLNLDDNYLSDDDLKAIKKVLPNADGGAQKNTDEDPDYRYPTVGE